MSRITITIGAILAFAGVSVCPDRVFSQDRIVNTVHNLSASGPGQMRASTEQQICVFCHAPHNTGGMKPLWNRQVSLGNYQIYQSSTLDATPGQPTGASKLCLSCHDGTIALGNVLSRSDQIRMVGGDFIPAGLTNLGSDLSDDHPISFHYTSGLAASDLQLVSPQALPLEVRLDAAGEMQCTSCHNPHNNVNGNFLALKDRYGELCIACHAMNGWSTSSHQSSADAVTASPTAAWPYATVAENACRSCHRSHTSGGKERLLIYADEEENCLACHGGQVGTANIMTEIDKPSAHDPRLYFNVHDPTESGLSVQAHVECADCHNPHAVSAQAVVSGYIPIGETLKHVPGVTSAGGQISEAQNEYEVCFRCHGDSPVQINGKISRQAETSNLRLKFSPTNPSFHPVVSSSPSPDTVSLKVGLPSGTMLRCTDCHNNDSGPRAGGGGVDGPHGSIYDFLLEKNYTTTDNTPESAFEYDLCYKCHERASILADESFGEHRKHLRENITCSACHDPHGVSLTQATGSDHTHLINFDMTIVRPLTGTNRLEFRDDGQFAGSCTLTCHGEDHDDETYKP